MGWWRAGKDGSSLHAEETGLVWGDGPADILDDAIDKIKAEFREAYKREPSRAELEAGLLFSLGAYEEPEGTPAAPQPQSEGAKALTAALGELIRTVADAPMVARTSLATCQMCRNSVLYLLDTEPYAGRASVTFECRIAGLPPRHGLFHANPVARDHGDSSAPVIRGLA